MVLRTPGCIVWGACVNNKYCALFSSWDDVQCYLLPSGIPSHYPPETLRPSAHSSVALNHFILIPSSPKLPPTSDCLRLWFELCLTVLRVINLFMYVCMYWWCLRKLLGNKWYHHVWNDDVRRKTEQPHLPATVQAWCLSLFGHIAWMSDESDERTLP